MNEIIEDIVSTLLDETSESYLHMFEDYDYYENLTSEDKVMFDDVLTKCINGQLGIDRDVETWYYEDGAIGLYLDYKPIENNVCVATLTPDSDVSPSMILDFLNTYNDIYERGTDEYTKIYDCLVAIRNRDNFKHWVERCMKHNDPDAYVKWNLTYIETTTNGYICHRHNILENVSIDVITNIDVWESDAMFVKTRDGQTVDFLEDYTWSRQELQSFFGQPTLKSRSRKCDITNSVSKPGYYEETEMLLVGYDVIPGLHIEGVNKFGEEVIWKY